MFRFGKELLWTMIWVFVVLILGFFLLNWLSTTNLPFISNSAQWVESHAQPS